MLRVVQQHTVGKIEIATLVGVAVNVRFGDRGIALYPELAWHGRERGGWTLDLLAIKIIKIRQTTWMWNANTGTWQVTEDLKLISDPMLFGRHIVELNATNNALVRSYVWGLDLSETLEGAGGVGGLLWICNFQSSSGAHLAAYDGNGNVVALVSATTGTETARYECGPFGELLCVTGPAATLNPFRFSTKRTCNTTDLVLYEYRAYNPSTGRWLSRDPIGEIGGENLYCFVGNAPTERADYLGMGWFEIRRDAGSQCCPACEIERLRRRLAEQEKILDAYKSGRDPGSSVSGLRVVAETRCYLGYPDTRFYEDTTTCVGWCTVLHEQVHRDQCEKHYADYRWKDYGKDPEVTAEIEIPAYERSIKCLRALIEMAEQQARKFGGSMKLACGCCREDKK